MSELFVGKRTAIPTERLVLRPFHDSDRKEAAAIFMDAAISRSYMLPDFPDITAVNALFERLKTLSESENRFVYAITLDDRLIGFLNEVDVSDGKVELGYVVARQEWNKGYATEAVRAAVEELFRLGVSAVRGGYFQWNDASRRVMEKAGMMPTGECDEIEYRGEVHRCPYMEIRK